MAQVDPVRCSVVLADEEVYAAQLLKYIFEGKEIFFQTIKATEDAADQIEAKAQKIEEEGGTESG